MKFVDEVAGLMSAEELSQISGFDFIRGILEERYPAPPICQTLNYWMVEAEPGKVTFRGRPEFGSMNPIGSIHGGWFGTLLDSCMACAVQTELPAGYGYTTLEYKINIIRPLMAGDADVLAIGEVQHVGRRTGIAEGRIVSVDGQKLYASGSTTCIVLAL